jgi:hypothetical protein
VAAATEAPELVQTGSVSADAGVPPVPGMLVRADPHLPIYEAAVQNSTTISVPAKRIHSLQHSTFYISPVKQICIEISCPVFGVLRNFISRTFRGKEANEIRMFANKYADTRMLYFAKGTLNKKRRET